MQKILFSILFLLFFIGCKEAQKNEKENNVFFTVIISPAFLERAEIIISKIDGIQEIQFLLKEANANDRPADTFYYKRIVLSENQFQKLYSGLIQKTNSVNSIEKKGMRDGINFIFTHIENKDTSILSFRSPSKETDTAAFRFIEKSFSDFRSIFEDSIIIDYLEDVETYIDYSKNSLIKSDDRAISKLRKIKYSR